MSTKFRWPNPLRQRVLRYAATMRRGIVQDVSREISRRQAVYCGDNVVLARLANGRYIYLDMRDASIAPGIALGEPWEPHVTATLAAIAEPGDVFFDVGANVGFHSIMLRDLIFEGGGQLHLFEPNPAMHRLLQRTFAANSFWTRVRIECLALSDSVGEATMSVYEDMWGGSRLQNPELLGSSEHGWAVSAVLRERFTVPTSTVDQYCASNGITSVDLMKIDTEGHEDAVFAGMTATLAGSPDIKVVMEFTFGAYSDPAGFWELLSRTFAYRYLIDRAGRLVRVTTLDDLRARVDVELADVLLSKVEVAPLPYA